MNGSVNSSGSSAMTRGSSGAVTRSEEFGCTSPTQSEMDCMERMECGSGEDQENTSHLSRYFNPFVAFFRKIKN